MEVSPNVLEFTGSFTKQTTEYLTLSNPTNSPLAFKVKTTAPKLYCVRPNASIVQPGDSVQISIILQGFSQPLPADYKCKDKFLLVSLPAPNVIDASKVGDSWSQLEAQHKSQMISKKLRVNYVIGPDKPDTHNANVTSNQAPAQQQQQQQAPVQQSPVQQQPQYTQQPSQQSIPQQQSHSNVGAAVGGVAAGGAAAAAAATAALGYNQQQNGDSSFNQGANRSFDTSSIHNGYQQQQQQQPPQQQYNGAGFQQQQQPQQFQQGGYQGAGYGGAGAQASSQPSPAVQRELEALARQVQTLSTKLDQNEKAASRNSVSSLVANGDDANGVSLPVALVLVLIAFLLGWLVF